MTKHVSLVCRYLDRIIRSSELEEFAALLQPHQKAVTSDGMAHLILFSYNSDIHT